MFLVVQLVVAGDHEGINAYLHEHRAGPPWHERLPVGVPDENPGELVRRSDPIHGQGRVRAYLDVAAPDGTGEEILGHAHDLVVATVRAGARFPLVVESGPVLVRYEVERALSATWHEQLDALVAAGRALL